MASIDHDAYIRGAEAPGSEVTHKIHVVDMGSGVSALSSSEHRLVHPAAQAVVAICGVTCPHRQPTSEVLSTLPA